MRPSKKTKLLVKATIPRIITDNPMLALSTKDGSFVESIPINQSIVRWMGGKHEAYFELVMDRVKIISMKPISEARFFETEHSILKAVPDDVL